MVVWIFKWTDNEYSPKSENMEENIFHKIKETQKHINSMILDYSEFFKRQKNHHSKIDKNIFLLKYKQRKGYTNLISLIKSNTALSKLLMTNYRSVKVVETSCKSLQKELQKNSKKIDHLKTVTTSMNNYFVGNVRT